MQSAEDSWKPATLGLEPLRWTGEREAERPVHREERQNWSLESGEEWPEVRGLCRHQGRDDVLAELDLGPWPQSVSLSKAM